MKFALLGNPNTGKSSLFNILTGLNQHVGNFPGVTVDKKFGKIKTGSGEHTLIDYPGTYSIYPRSKDQQVVYDGLISNENPDHPDALIAVLDVTNLKRNLLLFSQIYDLGKPTLMVLNMTDIAKKKGLDYDINALQKAFPEAKIVEAVARVRIGKDDILEAIDHLPERKGNQFLKGGKIASKEDEAAQEQETKERYQRIDQLLTSVLKENKKVDYSSKLDKILVHPIWGYAIFIAILIFIFQLIYSFAGIPMDWIDGLFGDLAGWTESMLPPGPLTELITQGVIPGVGGVVIFIPQIALLFFCIGILEGTGYLSRVVFIMDRLMRPLGLNGRSVVPMLSSIACAIPGVMAARTINDWKERMITIMVAPLMSCSARIPVYTLLIALVIPEETVLGVFNLQGLVLFALYMLGTVSAILVAVILKFLLKTKEKGFHLLEMPSYKLPDFRTVLFSVYEKTKTFVLEAGKIILLISIVLWGLARFGPDSQREVALQEIAEVQADETVSDEDKARFESSRMLESSYIGIMGRAIEPAISPLGFNWKIGISLITSFAAREVFVGSMATIYAVEDGGDSQTPLLDKMRNDKHPDSRPVFDLGTGLALLVFYVFAMQCMATLAVVKRETKSWKWPMYQLVYMGILAYLGAWITQMLF